MKKSVKNKLLTIPFKTAKIEFTDDIRKEIIGLRNKMYRDTGSSPEEQKYPIFKNLIHYNFVTGNTGINSKGYEKIVVCCICYYPDAFGLRNY